MSYRNVRALNVLAGVLLLISALLIVRFGIAALVVGQPEVKIMVQAASATAAQPALAVDAATSAATNFPSVPKGPTPTGDSQAQAILDLLNAARIKAGLQPLKLNDRLTAAADAHSRDQAQMDAMTHNGSDGSQPSERATKAGYMWSAVGENVLERPDVNAAGAFDQWWNSPPHHDNMMNPVFTEVGIAYARSKTGQYYYTMLLGVPR